MTDVLTPPQRKLNMTRIRNRDTKPEMAVRSIIHSMGYRYRLHRSDLPGTPDIVFPRLKKIVFVHGCFFHMHGCKYGKVRPSTNARFWEDKRKGNVSRDRSQYLLLLEAGWQVYVIWECETRSKTLSLLQPKLTDYLSQR